ncbi:MAG: bifunctional DNA primase/polymerase [Elusimicrobia bacterium]|nr:bifunctional DNA primase/polymerase [Elusimicrobiota bacterium]
MDRLGQTALEYSHRGWHVFPCRPFGKSPLTEHGFKDASLDLDKLRSWWTRWPNANLAIRTGVESGLGIVDIDPRNGGDESIRGHKLPYDTFLVLTGGGGAHFYFSVDTKLPSMEILPGVDYKGEGGYIIGPPSIHPNGKRYEVDSDFPLKPLPNWVLELLEKCRQPVEATEFSSAVGNGQRNLQLFRAACGFLRGSCTWCGGRPCTSSLPDHLFKRIRAMNLKRVTPPLSDQELRKIAANAFRMVRAKERGKDREQKAEGLLLTCNTKEYLMGERIYGR